MANAWQPVFTILSATETVFNDYFIGTGEHSQMVCMSVPVGGEIGEETHTVDQVLTFTSGSCKVCSTVKLSDTKS